MKRKQGIPIWLSLLFLGVMLMVPRGEELAMASPAPQGGKSVTLTLTSPAFAPGKPIPARYSCEGLDLSPPLRWSQPPSGTRSLVLICEDPDAPTGTWVHWVLFNLSPSLRELPEGVPPLKVVLEKAHQGKNDFGRLGYGGPCPPPGKPHRYFFRLYALDTQIQLPPGTEKPELLRAMEDHILAEGELMGIYQRKR
jgi:Raf kinase inhibitor-like YbhB/YbcL family protein